MAKTLDAEKKIVQLLKEEVGYVLAGAEFPPSRLYEFERFLDELSSAQGSVQEYIAKLNESELVASIDSNKFTELSRGLGSGRVKNWGSEVAEVLNKVRSEVQKLKDGGLDFIQQESSQVTFVGYSVKVSGVAKFVSSMHVNVEHIRIFALRDVVVDTNLNLPGGDVTILAPLWDIAAPSMINLKGKIGSSYDMPSASSKSFGGDGSDGVTGRQGGNGGNFYGVGEGFVNLENLNINVDGGSGGAGQKGGDGFGGQDFTHSFEISDDVKPLVEWLKYIDSASSVIYSDQFRTFIDRHPYGKGLLDKIRLKWHEVIDSITKNNGHLFKEQVEYLGNLREFTEITIKQFHEENKHSAEHRTLFKRGSSIFTKKLSFEQAEQQLYELSKKLFTEERSGQKLGYGTGGSAGAGGAGGAGGIPGTHDLISLGGLLEKWYQPKSGDIGQVGESGYAGAGGKVVLNLSNPNKAGLCCGKKELAHAALNLTAPSGSIRYNNAFGQPVQENIKKPNLHLSIIDYQLLMGQKSQMMSNLSKPFTSRLKEVETDERAIDFANELLQLEEYIAKPGVKFDFADSYHLLAQRISNKANDTSDVQEVKVLKYLYTSALTRISQLKAASSGKLVIDINSFLSLIKSNIEELGERYDADSIAAHKTKYAEGIESKINEAKKFAQDLVQDIEHAGSMLDEQFKKYLEEIDRDIRQTSRTTIDLEASKVKLQNAITKTLIFNTLGIVISSAGMIFGPPGAIVAKIVQTGIGMIDNPNFQEHDSIIENLEKLSSSWDTVSSNQVASFTNSAKPAMYALSMLSRNLTNERNKLASVTTAIKQAETLITQLQEHKKEMSSSFDQRIDEITSQVKDIHKNLENKSVVAIEFNKAEVVNFFNGLKAELSKITGNSSDGFCDAINKMLQALETSMIIHEHIQEYKDQIIFANYIAQINSPGFKESIADGELGSVIQRLEKITQRNIALEQYYMAVSVIKQWSFPFARNFLESFDKMPNFLSLKEEEFIPKLRDQMKKMIKEVVKDKTFVSSLDELITEDDFTDEPFFAWSYNNYSNQVTDLLNGKQVFLHADVKTSPKHKGAIKFMDIKLQIKGSDDAKIKESLQGYKIELWHSGCSYYRFTNNIYSVQHDIIKMSFSPDLKTKNETFKKINKASQEDPMISPYTWWVVTLKSKDEGKHVDTDIKTLGHDDGSELNSPLFNRLKDILPSIQIQLVGKGRFVDETQIRQNFQVDTYYEQVITSVPQFRLELKPKPNAFNQITNPNYVYQVEDIALIQNKLMQDFIKDITLLPPSPSEQTIQKAISIQKPVLFACSQDGVNWTTVAILTKSTALFTKPLEDLSTTLNALGINNVLHSQIQQFKACDSGPIALACMQIIAEGVKQNPTKLISTFDNLTITSYPDQLRSEFANMYANAVYNQIEAKKSVELPEFLAALNIPNNDKTTRELAKKIYNTKDHTMTELLTAAQNCDSEAIQALAKQDIDIDKPDNNGRTLLHWAALHNDGEAIQTLLSQGANIEAKDNQGWTPLFLATYYNACNAIQTLIQNSADIETKVDNWTPLLLAASRGNAEATDLLLFHKANIQAKLGSGKTSLHIAALENRLNALQVLVKYKAPLEAKTEDGWTALMLAVEKGYIEATKFLISNGADIHTMNKGKSQSIHAAAAKGHPEMINLLLDQGAKIESKEKGGFTPLHWAVYNGQSHIISLLLRRGADLEARDNTEKTPLHWAAAVGQVETLRTLLDLGANIHSTSMDLKTAGYTSLHLSSKNGEYETSKELLLRGANKEALDEILRTPLHLCVITGQLKVVQLLLDNNADIDPFNVNKHTPLYLSARHNHYKLVLLFLTKGANKEAQDIAQLTPLLTASENNSYESLVLLLHHGANRNAKDCDGFTATYLAKQKGYTEIVQLLASYPSPAFEQEYERLIESIEHDEPFTHGLFDHLDSVLSGKIDHL